MARHVRQLRRTSMSARVLTIIALTWVSPASSIVPALPEAASAGDATASHRAASDIEGSMECGVVLSYLLPEKTGIRQ